MDNVTQQNAALVEEASAASKSMEQQSATLVSQIGYFRRADGSGITGSGSHAHHQHATAEVVRMAAPATRPRPAARKAAPVASRPVRSAASSSSAPAPLARAAGDDSQWSDF
jgi:methyl-accepting chemotaxis protein I, serine sensor receptor